jgi:hypothetical protein
VTTWKFKKCQCLGDIQRHNVDTTFCGNRLILQSLLGCANTQTHVLIHTHTHTHTEHGDLKSQFVVRKESVLKVWLHLWISDSLQTCPCVGCNIVLFQCWFLSTCLLCCWQNCNVMFTWLLLSTEVVCHSNQSSYSSCVVFYFHNVGNCARTDVRVSSFQAWRWLTAGYWLSFSVNQLSVNLPSQC